MIRPKHLRRLLLLGIVLGVAYAGLAARLVVLQVMQHDEHRIQADRTRVFLTEPQRGDILDVNGNPLATSVPVKKIFANPRFLGTFTEEVAEALAPVLRVPKAELAQQLRPTLRTNEQGRLTTNAWVNLKKKVNLETWLQVTQAMARVEIKLPAKMSQAARLRFLRPFRQQAVYAEDDQQRVYPNGPLAAHLLGYVQDLEQEFNRTVVTETVGQYGIEHWFNAQLQGVRGWRIAETDPRRHEIVVYRQQEVQALPGLNIVLTIDSVIQNLVEKELANAMSQLSPRSAAAMVVRPRTGEILALAVLPNFDPNQPGKAKADQLRNRVIADTYEPGSTFKIVAVGGALNERVVRLTDTINCEGGLWMYGGKRLKDHGRYNVMTVENVVCRSSNIGVAKIGIMLGEERLARYVRAFGFGSRTEIPLAGEVAATLPPTSAWDKLKISRIPIGQGVAVTHVQMIMAMCAVANQGRLMRPMLVNRLEYRDGRLFAQYQPQVVRQVISEDTAKLEVTALKTVVSSNGTGSKAILDHYTAAGKTGTAQKAVPGGYSDEYYVASFVGFFPADAPELCISVVLDEPDKAKGYYGGQAAAPTFKAIAEQTAKYLKIRPDREESVEAIVGKPGAEPVRTAALRSL